MERVRRLAIPAVTLVVGVTLVVLRRPDSVLNAQFWAEDGRDFFADAYNLGSISALFRPYNGNLHLASRALAGIATLFPLAIAPLVMNVGAILIQALPAAVLASRKMASAFPDPRMRFALALLYLVGPGATFEVTANATNSQWHLAVLAWCLVVTQSRTDGPGAWVDAAVVLFSALTGPLGILLLPVAASATWLRERRVITPVNLALLVGAAVQGAVLVLSGSRQIVDRGASFEAFNVILACHVFVGGVAGDQGCPSLHGWLPFAILPTVIVLAGLSLVIYAVVKGPVAVRLFVAFSALVFAAALASGLLAWNDLAYIGNSRYWFIPTYAMGMIFVWLCAERVLAMRAAGYAATCAMAVAAILNWRQPPLVNFRFGEAMRWFSGLPAGSVAAFPLNPVVLPGEQPWGEMILHKRAE